MKKYTIEIEINASKETVWKAITDFANYPTWNSILKMENNDSLTLGNKFQVTITQTNGKKSKFKARAIGKQMLQSFSATQIILDTWFFQAIHHFIIKEVDKGRIVFIQEWDLKGILSTLFRKQIFKELSSFKKMNSELKAFIER